MLIKISIKLLLVIAFSSSAIAQSQWELVWSDEFNYNGLPDGNKWYFEHGPDWPNGELQYYTLNRQENARVANGTLTIEAKQEQFGGRQYTSARLLSNIGFTYGRMEIRAKLTQGESLWPAIWMFPINEIYGGWPNSGEIDIMENWSWDANGVYGTVHTEAYNHINHTEKQGRIEFNDLSSEFHVFAIEWYEDQIRWFVDDVLFFTLYNQGTTASFPFDHPFHFILNVAVEGNAPGKESTWTKRTMEIDYVRVYDGPLVGPAPVYYSIPGTVESENYFDAAGVRNQNNATGMNVGFIDADDWMDYRVEVNNAQQYTTHYTVSSPTGGSFELRSGDTVLETITVPNTQGWQVWQEVEGSISLPAGNHILRLHSVTGGFNIDRMRFEFSDESPNITPVLYDCIATAASSAESSYQASNVCDKNASSRWASDWNDNQWIEIDLGESREVVIVELQWEAAFAQEYRLQGSDDGSQWFTLANIVGADGDLDSINLENANARFLRMEGIQRGTSYGYSLFSFDVYGPDTDGSDPSDGGPNNPGSLVHEIQITNDWGQGYCANLYVKNEGTSSVVWSLNIDVGGQIYNMWNGEYSQNNTLATISGPSWNNSLAPNQSDNSLGFCVSR